MKTILFVSLACGQVLIASQVPIYEGTDYGYRQPHSSVVSGIDPQKKKMISKACQVTGVTASIFLPSVLVTCLSASDDYYKPFVLGGIGGTATYIYLTLNEDLE